jgi:hypothetical protein
VAVPTFSTKDQERIAALTQRLVTTIEDGCDLTWTSPVKRGWLFGGGVERVRELNANGGGLVYRRGNRPQVTYLWTDIDKIGYFPGGPGTSPYIFVTGKEVGPSDEIKTTELFGFGDQAVLWALRVVHERKVGRYIYPRLREPSTLVKAVGLVAEWEPKDIPEGVPPPINYRSSK